MFKGLKINTAIIICVAFLFRLFSLSLSVVSTSGENPVLGSNLATYSVSKTTSLVESEKSSKSIFTEVVFSEEDPDDENEFKSFTPVLLETFCNVTLNNNKSHLQAITPSNKHFTCNSTQRHLEFGVFRI